MSDSHPQEFAPAANADATPTSTPAPTLNSKNSVASSQTAEAASKAASKETAKVALITGITGQDGSYLAEFLIAQGYIVHGIKRRSSSLNTQRIDDLYEKYNGTKLFLHYGDLTDSANIMLLVSKIAPDEIYNLGAQSHVAVSFEQPEYTANVNYLGTLRLLEAIRSAGLAHKTKFYQASTSELFGLVQEIPQRETTPFFPRSPYAVAKLGAYWTVVNYRQAYGIFAVNGILFNHESPRRGETFVTRKITRAFADMVLGQQQVLELGNLDAMRDWGHAADYVRMQWLMLQNDTPQDYVIATGKQYSVRFMVDYCASLLGLQLEWRGSGVDEHAVLVGFDGVGYMPAPKASQQANQQANAQASQQAQKQTTQTTLALANGVDYNLLQSNPDAYSYPDYQNYPYGRALSFVVGNQAQAESPLAYEPLDHNQLHYFRHQARQNLQLGQTLVKVNPAYFRPTEVSTLLGNPQRATEELGWVCEFDALELIKEMQVSDCRSTYVRLFGTAGKQVS